MVDQLGGQAPAGEGRQHPDVRHRGVVDDCPTRKRQPAGHGICGADQFIVDECADGAPGFQQCGDLAGLQVQGWKPDHGGAKDIRGSQEFVLALQHADVGAH